MTPSHEQDEIRLVPMRVAGTYSRGGLKLVTVADGHRAAWDSGITEEEGTRVQGVLDLQASYADPDPPLKRARDKLTAAFQREPAS